MQHRIISESSLIRMDFSTNGLCRGLGRNVWLVVLPLMLLVAGAYIVRNFTANPRYARYHSYRGGISSANEVRQIRGEDPGPFLGQGSVPEFFSHLSSLEAEGLVTGKILKTSYECSEAEKIGSHQGAGGYTVCLDPPYHPKQNDCLVYSFGIQRDWTFDEGMHDKFGCEVHSFDPSIGLDDHLHRENMYFHNLGIWGSNTVNDKDWTLMDLKSIMEKLNHTKRTIDYLKFDVEGAEWGIFDHIVQSGISSHIKQFGTEIHAPRYKKVVQSLSVVDYGEVFHSLHELERVGFEKFLTNTKNWCINYAPLLSKRLFGKDLQCVEVFYVNRDFIYHDI